ncbi:50S RIBOSOMAL PROTEIN L21 [Salix purpurea]|uniref:50S RIBOSOMAL PROTEIN L21 n=1 Tax=Salix purpurea TaxID=77065 RepID=A0A9Q0VBY4_SALPP|nr:50S RIBOSOMAL PROTEIN L21 [Salix purpurea]
MAASSSTALVALCSSLTTQCKISKSQNSPFSKTLSLSKPNFGSFSDTTKKLSSPLVFSKRPPFFARPKVSESEATVIEAETEVSVSEANSEPSATQIVEVTKEEPPKREEIFAVVMVGSRQYIVIPGRWLYVQRLKGANVNDKIVLNKVLLVGTRTSAYIGKPVVTNASVHAVVEEQGLDAKKIVFKYKRKKNYRRNIGHRQAEIF